MTNRSLALALAALTLGNSSCQRPEGRQTGMSRRDSAAPKVADAPAPARPGDSQVVAPVTSAAESASARPPAATATASAGASTPIASQETNWPGIIAEVVEFRRRGNTLTTRVRFRNQGDAEAEPDIHYSEAYLMDAAGAKKYEVLKDETGHYIAGLRTGYPDRWYQKIQPGQSQVIWMKFPAPPAEVKSVTFQLPGAPPFEELVIEGS
jgi:hypothetical protein